jgi:hypothetical protein
MVMMPGVCRPPADVSTGAEARKREKEKVVAGSGDARARVLRVGPARKDLVG